MFMSVYAILYYGLIHIFFKEFAELYISRGGLVCAIGGKEPKMLHDGLVGLTPQRHNGYVAT